MRLGSFVEALLQETEALKHSKREKARSSKPDPFFHAKRLAERSLQLLGVTCRASTRGWGKEEGKGAEGEGNQQQPKASKGGGKADEEADSQGATADEVSNTEPPWEDWVEDEIEFPCLLERAKWNNGNEYRER